MNNEMLLIFTAFIIKHFICDFPLQRSYHYLNKGKYGHLGGISHAGIHAIGTIIVCWLFSMPLWLSAVDFVIHYHVDWAKTNINDHFKLKPDNSEYYWHLLGLDQMAHYLTYVLLIWIAS